MTQDPKGVEHTLSSIFRLQLGLAFPFVFCKEMVAQFLIIG